MSEEKYKSIIIIIIILISIATTFFITKQYMLSKVAYGTAFRENLDNFHQKIKPIDSRFNREGREAHIIKRMSEELTLSAEQEQIFNETIEDIIEFRKQQRKIKSNREGTIITLINKEKITVEDVMDLHQSRISEMKATDKFVAEKLIFIHSTLTTEQKEILIKKIQSFQKRVRN